MNQFLLVWILLAKHTICLIDSCSHPHCWVLNPHLVLLLHLCDHSAHGGCASIGLAQVAKQGGWTGVMHPGLSVATILILILHGLV